MVVLLGAVVFLLMVLSSVLGHIIMWDRNYKNSRLKKTADSNPSLVNVDLLKVEGQS